MMNSLLSVAVTALVAVTILIATSSANSLFVAAQTKDDMNIGFIQNASLRLARANDGSPAAFYYKKALDPSSKQVLIFQNGGWSCQTPSSCAKRWAGGKEEMSSKGLPPTWSSTGYYSQDCLTNPFCKAHMIFLPYLSSDLYVGNVSANHTPGIPFEFRGKVIVQSILEDILQNGLAIGTDPDHPTEIIKPFGAGTRLVWSGSSAGGFGVLLNTNFVGELVKTKLCPSCDIAMIVDSGYFSGTVKDQFSYNCTEDLVFCPLAQEARLGFDAWNAVLDTQCLASMKSLKKPAYSCMFGEIATQYLGPFRTFFAEYVFDMAELTEMSIMTKIITSPIKARIELIELVQTKKAVLGEVVAKSTGVTVFMPSCTGHETGRGLNDLVAGVPHEPIKLNAALSEWYFHNMAKFIHDDCTGENTWPKLCRHCPGY